MILSSGACIGPEEKEAMHKIVDSGWLTGGPVINEFEEALSAKVGARYSVSVNSGSSANLLAVAAMVEAGYWKAGDEIICLAVSFPTTINPLLLYGLVPVFVDVGDNDYSINMDEVEEAYTPKTKGVMVAHTLGLPFDLGRMMRFVEDKGIYLIEDCCDALGSTYNGKNVGTFGIMGTCSFFPAHHITTGEGGAVWSSIPKLKRVLTSIRDWGRSCFCGIGEENACGARFAQKQGGLPYGYDHKYTYDRLGFNLKMMDVGAACGVEQLKKLDWIRSRRVENAARLERGLSNLVDWVRVPKVLVGADPNWFGFPITVLDGDRAEFQEYLSKHGVSTRLVFGGDITLQPYLYEGSRHKYRVASELKNTKAVTNQSIWLPVHPGVSEEDTHTIIGAVAGYYEGVGV